MSVQSLPPGSLVVEEVGVWSGLPWSVTDALMSPDCASAVGASRAGVRAGAPQSAVAASCLVTVDVWEVGDSFASSLLNDATHACVGCGLVSWYCRLKDAPSSQLSVSEGLRRSSLQVAGARRWQR